MGDKTAIEWCDATWNVLRGCSRVSEGCRHCYAEREAGRHGYKAGAMADDGRIYKKDGAYLGLVRNTRDGPRWTGEVRFVEETLSLPLRWKTPRRIFVNSMSDLFHEKVEERWIDAIFAVMSQAPQHMFQVLTKRPERMRAYFADEYRVDRVEEVALQHFPEWCHANTEGRWPLPNVWLGVSVEDQARADARIPLLLQTPAAIRFISYEPALGPISLLNAAGDGLRGGLRGGLYWGIYGGESGPGARRNSVAWARRFVHECRAAKIAPFIKQLGTFVVDRNDAGFTGWDYGEGWPDGTEIEEHINGYREDYQGASVRVKLRDRKGGDWDEWPADLRIREFPA